MRTDCGHILVVDDNEINRDILTKNMNRLGHRTYPAKNGLEALDMLKTQNFDLVLLDIMMPIVDGYQVLENMKADQNLNSIPVIIISANDEIESIIRCIQMGADDYLAKPFNKDILRARINNSLEKKWSRDKEIYYRQQLEKENVRYEELLKVVFPEMIVHELKTTYKVKPRRHENVSVLFCDIVDFTGYCEQTQPEIVVTKLQMLVEVFEEISTRYCLEKIKTSGDAFIATGGLLKPLENPVLNCVQCGIEMLSTIRSVIPEWNVRIGIHVGNVIAGVIGRMKYLYDLWGDTVNVAQRIESNGFVDAVNLSKAAYENISNIYKCESIGLINVKGKGPMEIFKVMSNI